MENNKTSYLIPSNNNNSTDSAEMNALLPFLTTTETYRHGISKDDTSSAAPTNTPSYNFNNATETFSSQQHFNSYKATKYTTNHVMNSNISIKINDTDVFNPINNNHKNDLVGKSRHVHFDTKDFPTTTTEFTSDITVQSHYSAKTALTFSQSNSPNSTHFTNSSTIDTLFNASTNQSLTTGVEYFNLVPGQTTTTTSTNSFINDSNSTNDYHIDYNFQEEWREHTNITTLNESVIQINDSVFFLTPYHDRSNAFFSGMTKIDSSPETITKVFILAIVSIFGSIGNFLVVGSVIKNRNLHRPPFYFLLSMGITDLARAGFCLPVVMATALQGSIWRHGDTACKMFAFAASFFVFSSTLSLLVIAVERHLSIVHAKAYRRRCHGFVNLFATIFIWVTAFLISFPPIFSSIGAGEYVFISEEAQCAYDHKHFSHNDGLNAVLTFIGITSLTLFLYYRIFVFMRSHRRMRPLQHRPAFSSTWTFVGPGANGQAFINWLNGFGGNASNVYQRPQAALAATVTAATSFNDPGTHPPTFHPHSTSISSSGGGGRGGGGGVGGGGGGGGGRGGGGGGAWESPSPPPPRSTTQRLNFGRVVNLCTTRNEHLTRLFFIMTLVHGATWLPYVILSLWRVFIARSSNIPTGFIAYAAWLSYAQVAICPLTYFLSRGRSKNASRVIHMEPAERNEFLLENKILK